MTSAQATRIQKEMAIVEALIEGASVTYEWKMRWTNRYRKLHNSTPNEAQDAFWARFPRVG